MGTPKTTTNKLSREGQSKEEKNKEKKTATKKKVKLNDKQVQQEKKKNNNNNSKKNKDNSSSQNNGTVKSKIRIQSDGSPSASRNKRRRKEKNEEHDEEEEDSKLLNVFPMNRVQRIAKSEGSDFKMSQEAYFLINKATEKFIGQFCEDAYDSAPPRDRRGFFKYKHLSSVVCKEKRYDFLSDFVPEKIKMEDALKETKAEET